MDVLEAAAVHHAYGVALSRSLAAQLSALWRRVDRNRIGPSWAGLAPLAVGFITEAQEAAVADAGAYMAAAFVAQGLDPAGPSVDGSQLSGVASDGRPLETLAMSPVFSTLHEVKAGNGVERGMASGLSSLLLIGQTLVSDAARSADGLVMASRERPPRYARMLNPPSCSRCAILAGRLYRASAAFDRHPGCDCRHIPVAESGDDATTDPYEYFNSLDPAEQARIFTKAGAKAIEDGADIFQVVNARRGMSTTAGGSKVTNEGVTRRGYWGSQQETRDRRGQERYGRSTRQRMMPEEIYKRARSQEDVIRLLTDHGYITPAGQVPTGAIFGAGKGELASRYR